MTNLKDLKAKKIDWEKRFDLLWGIAPEGSLKFERGEEIKRFIEAEIKSSYQAGREEVISKIDKWYHFYDK